MSKALIGYTGFVGGNLLTQQTFNNCYNSRNIAAINAREFTTVYCAGVPAAKWIANREPDNDKQNIDALCSHLNTIKADKFILISTVDVYPEPIDVDESSPINLSACQPYGKHRLQLEEFISARFDTLIVRLPGLFGKGLKKNIIFDFLNDNNIEQINPNGVFQFYDLKHLRKDIDIALQHDLSLLNISSEPVSVTDVAQVCLGDAFDNGITDPGARYDYRSQHAALYGGNNGYLYSKSQILEDLQIYVAEEKLVGSNP